MREASGLRPIRAAVSQRDSAPPERGISITSMEEKVKEHYQNLNELLAHEIFTEEVAAQAIIVALREGLMTSKCETKLFIFSSDVMLDDVLSSFRSVTQEYGSYYALGWLVSTASEVTTLNGWSAVEAYHSPEQYADACAVYGSNREMPFLYRPLPLSEQAALQLADQGYPVKEVEAYLHFLHKNGE